MSNDRVADVVDDAIADHERRMHSVTSHYFDADGN